MQTPRQSELEATATADVVLWEPADQPGRMSSVLSITDCARLRTLEERIERGLATFVDVGSALMEVRDSRLYRQTHETFEVYCSDRWQISRPRAYELIGAAEVAENVSAMADIPTPQSERVARPLTRLEPEQQREAWTEVVQTAPRDSEGKPKITAAHVESVVRTREPQLTNEQRRPRRAKRLVKKLTQRKVGHRAPLKSGIGVSRGALVCSTAS